MTDLTEFLLARIAEDEAVANHASGPEWHQRDRDDGYFFIAANTAAVASAIRPEDRAHIARHDPARVLAECAAKRQIIESLAQEEWFMFTLAAVYADHPDFRPEWRA